MTYVVLNGVPTDAAYPTYAGAKGACRNATNPATNFNLADQAYGNFSGDEDLMMRMMNKFGPVVTMICKCNC
jgi:hypothetical protein